MKIALINELHRIRPSGGTYYSTKILYEAFNARGHSSQIFSIKPRNKFINKIISMPTIREMTVLPIWCSLTLRKISKSGYDVVFTRTTTSFWLRPKINAKTVTYTSAFLARQLDIIANLNINIFLRTVIILLKYPLFWMEKDALIKSDRIIVPRVAFKKYIRKEMKISNKRINVIPQTIDFSVKYDVTAGPKVYDLLYVGRLSTPKNIEMIENIASLTTYKILAISSKLKYIAPNVKVRSARREDLPKIYASSKIFIMPSFVETGPLVTLEAMAFGLPVVASPEGAGDFVIDKVNGFIVKNNDPRQYVVCINKLMEDEKLYRQISLRNFQRAKKFHSSSLTSKYLAVLGDTLKY